MLCTAAQLNLLLCWYRWYTSSLLRKFRVAIYQFFFLCVLIVVILHVHVRSCFSSVYIDIQAVLIWILTRIIAFKLSYSKDKETRINILNVWVIDKYIYVVIGNSDVVTHIDWPIIVSLPSRVSFLYYRMLYFLYMYIVYFAWYLNGWLSIHFVFDVWFRVHLRNCLKDFFLRNTNV